MSESKQPSLMDVIFGQLEITRLLAVKAGEAELAGELSDMLERSLERYCEIKRASLSEKLTTGS